MHLLYLDESGNENDPSDKFFVLAGLAPFERQTHFINQQIDAVQEKHFPNHQPIPFHASAIRSGREFWRKVSEEKRREVIRDLGNAVLPARGGICLFAAAIQKDQTLYGDDAVAAAIKEMCQRFDKYLTRQYPAANMRQRGLLIFSDGRFNARAKLLVAGYRRSGTEWGRIKNFADIPYFAQMQESRLLQAADYVAHATWLLYERRDPSLIRPLLPYFDVRQGKAKGLVHVGAGRGTDCSCPACYSRRLPGFMGPWVGDETQLELGAPQGGAGPLTATENLPSHPAMDGGAEEGRSTVDPA